MSDFIFGNDVPKPCRHFCGRDSEIEKLHNLLEEHGKIFLHGIAGIGKSELAKAYASRYKKEYTNILYIVYSGDLKRDITDMDFSDDLPDEDREECFRRHNRFLRTLKQDTLFIIDNFNVPATKDSFLPVVMKYRCRVLFTTRGRMEHYPSMQLEEISDNAALLELMGRFYSDAGNHADELEQIIGAVHSHTLAVELAARLLEKGLLDSKALLAKLKEEKAALDSADKISITKDGKPTKETYYGHIHTLFSLFHLSDPEQDIMRNMALIPLTGIPARRLADWLSLTNLNVINDLVENGFLTPLPERSVSLHPMIQEITAADLEPSLSSCMTLCRKLQAVCLMHGLDISYHKLLFATVKNIIKLVKKDDGLFYIRFLEDVFPYMEKYHYEQGMHTVLSELEKLVMESPSDPDSPANFANTNDRALLLDYKATLEKNTVRAIRLEKDALAMLTEINAGNAHLAANLHSNLGALYRIAGQLNPAMEHMKTGAALLEQYHLVYTHDSVAITSNYAALLCDMGQPESAIETLRSVAQAVKKYNSELSGDYALLMEAMGSICLIQGKIPDAREHFKQAMAIYETLWDEEPELLEAKKQEILETYAQAGIGLVQKLLV